MHSEWCLCSKKYTANHAAADEFGFGNISYNPTSDVLNYYSDGNGLGGAFEIAVLRTTSFPAVTASDFYIV